MTGSPSAPVQPSDENAPLRQSSPVSMQRDAVQSGQERIKKPRRRIRRSIVGLLVALSWLPVVLSATVVWAHQTVLNTGSFVGTVAPVFKNPAVASAVAVSGTDELFTQFNLQARLRAALPPKASFAAVPITNATEGFVAVKLTKMLASPSSRPSGPRR